MKQNFYSDTELLNAVAKGNSDAIKSIYEIYNPMMIKWICSKGGKREDAEDAFQDAILVLHQKANDSEFCLTCKLSTYLFAVCKRIWLKKLQQAVPSVTLEQDNEEENIQLEAEEIDVKIFLTEERNFNKLEAAVKELGAPCEGLIKAFYFEQKSMQEIATLFHYTNPQNAKTQKYKCLNRLRKIFYAKTIKVK